MKKFILITLAVITMSFASSLSIAKPTFACESTFFGIPAWYRGLTDGNCDIAKMNGEEGITKFVWTVILNLADGIFRIAGVVATGFIVWAGFQYMISQGNSGAIANAKTTMKNAIVGLIITALASLIINFVFNLMR